MLNGRTSSPSGLDRTNGFLKDHPQNTADRQEIYAAIESEIKHAESKADAAHTLGEFILMLNERADEARRRWVRSGGGADGSPESLEEIRRIAALAVRCMAQHGAPERMVNALAANPRAGAQGGGSDW